MKPRCKILFILAAFAFSLSLPSTTSVFATDSSTVVETTFFGNINDEGDGCGVFTILNLVVDILSIGVGVLGVIGISIAGIQYLTSAGKEDQARRSRVRIFQIIIGLAVYAIMYTGINWLTPGGKLNTGSSCSTLTNEQLAKMKATEAKKKAEELAKRKASNTSSKSGTKSAATTGKDSNGTTALGRRYLNEVEKTVNEFVRIGVVYHVESSSSWNELYRTKRADCTSAADLTMQKMKLIPYDSYIYFDNYGKTLKMRRGADKGINKYFKIIKGNNTIANLVKAKKLAPGDVCGDANFPHHTIIYLGKKGGSYRIHSFGSGKFSKSRHHNVPVSGSYRIGTILHPK